MFVLPAGLDDIYDAPINSNDDEEIFDAGFADEEEQEDDYAVIRETLLR